MDDPSEITDEMNDFDYFQAMNHLDWMPQNGKDFIKEERFLRSVIGRANPEMRKKWRGFKLSEMSKTAKVAFNIRKAGQAYIEALAIQRENSIPDDEN